MKKTRGKKGKTTADRKRELITVMMMMGTVQTGYHNLMEKRETERGNDRPRYIKHDDFSLRTQK
jgi:hypothetical protein